MTTKIAHLVWQNVNKLKGLQGRGIWRKRFWAWADRGGGTDCGDGGGDGGEAETDSGAGRGGDGDSEGSGGSEQTHTRADASGRGRGEQSAGKKKKETGQPQGGVQSDRGQRVKRVGVSGDSRDRGKRGREASRLGGVPSDSKQKGKGGVASDKKKWPTGQGPGWNSKKAVTGFLWDPKERRLNLADGSDCLSLKAEAEAAEARKDEAAVQVAMDVFAGTQSMGPVYRQRMRVEYIPLDKTEEL